MANEVISALRDSGESVAACGSTGVSAALVDGIKVHSLAGFCNGDADVTTPLELFLDEVIPIAAKARMRSATVLVRKRSAPCRPRSCRDWDWYSALCVGVTRR